MKDSVHCCYVNKKESYIIPDDKGLSLHWYAIETCTGCMVQEAH